MKARPNQESQPTFQRERILRMKSFRARDQTRKDIGRQMHGCVYCDKTGYFSAKKLPKNYLSWRPQKDPQPPASCRSRGCHNFQRKHNTSICEQINNVSVRRFLREPAGSLILLFLSRLMESNALHSLTLEQAVHMHPLPLHEQFNHIEMTLGSVNKLRPSVFME